MKRSFIIFVLLGFTVFFSGSIFLELNPYRVYPYLQVYDKGKIQLTWFSNTLTSSEITLKNASGEVILTQNVVGQEVPEIFYTDAEKNETISGLEKGSWLQSDQAYRYQVQLTPPPGIKVSYQVSLGGSTFESSFNTPKDKNNWEKIRFVALADSETEPKGRVTNREWFPGQPLFRPFTIPQLWKDKFGFTTLEAFEIPNYFLTEQKGYAENLKIINSRDIDFMVMPGDLVQGGGYQPGWDEFFRHNAGEFDKGFSTYPVIPSLGNWENSGALNGGYGEMPGGQFAPVVARSRYQAYFKTPVSDPLQKHGQSYYRSDYGPITILTVDSSNGTPDQLASDFDGVTKLTGKEFTVPGTDTQENFTEATYKARGGNDLSSFGPGSDQYAWLEANLRDAKESGQLIFVQYHHIAFSSGERGVPLNHELSVGQVGTPMQILHPLFEQYEVIAVFSGHDEIFERSFVDADNDGKGVVYYDVGVAGDGIRSVKRDWKNNPLNTLDYNPYSTWTADQNSVEQWNTSGPVPILTDGGKHYGHLEVNVVKVTQDGKPFARIDFTPVYVFPVLDQSYNLQRVERRVYPDERSLLVALNQAEFVPMVKDSVSIFLNEEGKALLTPEDFLEVQPDDPFTYTSSVGFDFTCTNIGENEVVITSKNTLTDQEWIESTRVWVFDTIPPDFEATDAFLAFDYTIGKVIIDPTSFYIREEFIYENCPDPVVNINISLKEITCSDLDPDGTFFDKPVTITMTDMQGNSTTKIRKINLNIFESNKVSISSSETFVGQPVTLTLGDEKEYSVSYWQRFFQGQTESFAGQQAKTFVATLPGLYSAVLNLESGCSVTTEPILLEIQDADYKPVIKDSVSIFINEVRNALLTPEDFLEVQPIDPFTYTSSVGFDFTCSNIGENEVIITAKNTLTNQEWIESTKVWVFDTIPPYFDAGNATLLFDPVVGKVSFDLIDFYIVDFRDNCSKNFIFEQSRYEVTCADIYQDPNAPVWEFPVEITATDESGNTSYKTVNAIIGNIVESKKVTITSTGPLEEGGTTTLVLGDELDYTVLDWEPDFRIVNQSGNEATIATSGNYRAKLMLSAGCPVYSEELRFGELTAYYNQNIVLYLDESGAVNLSPEDVLVNDPQFSIGNLILSQSKFTCEDLGINDVKVIQSNNVDNPRSPVRFEDWIKVIVKDERPPLLTTKIPSLSFDLVKGRLELSPEDFVDSLSDNCGITDLYLNKTTITCADYDSPIDLILTAVDPSGNTVSESITINVTPVESQKISINPSGNFEGFAGEPIEIRLGDEFGFSLVSWVKDGEPILGENEKVILVTLPGTYWAKIIPDGGCSVLSEKVIISFKELPFGEVKELVELSLDALGKAALKPEDVFVSWPPTDPNLDIKLSQSEFTCSDIGEKQITITIKNLTGQTWEERTIVKIQDNIKPVLIPKVFNADFDVTVGSLVLKPENFITELTDNCEVSEVTINKTTATCEDLGKEIPVSIRAVDASGNVVEAVATLTLNRIETKKVILSGDSEFCEGEKGVLTLTSEAQFEVIRWRRDGVEIAGQNGQLLMIEVGGIYDAVVRYEGGCLTETGKYEVKVNPIPTGEIKPDGNKLIAPEGDFTYQWFRNEVLIPEATERVLTLFEMGSYTVELTNATGCKAKLTAITVTIAGLIGSNMILSEELIIYPNPAYDQVELEIKSDQIIDLKSLRIYSMEGKEVTHAVMQSNSLRKHLQIDISGLAAGNYMVMLEGEDRKVFVGKFIKK